MKTNTNTYQIKSYIEVANIFQEYLYDYQRKYNLHPTHRKVVQDILNCRTAILGGHIEKCDECGTERITFNSCRNRHCPKCQTMAKEKWLKARKAELLPVSYFHNVLCHTTLILWCFATKKKFIQSCSDPYLKPSSNSGKIPETD